MCPLVLRDYFDNLVLWLFPRCDVGELVTRSTHDTAEPIHCAVAGIDDAYFRSFVDFTSSRAVEADGLIPIADTAEVVVRPITVHMQGSRGEISGSYAGIPMYEVVVK
uniref:Uncharacterized protein n=1 Tax=Oryza barthii TaxID=65489 RepID=A0A0D3GZ25_9ORYZ